MVIASTRNLPIYSSICWSCHLWVLPNLHIQLNRSQLPGKCSAGSDEKKMSGRPVMNKWLQLKKLIISSKIQHFSEFLCEKNLPVRNFDAADEVIFEIFRWTKLRWLQQWCTFISMWPSNHTYTASHSLYGLQTMDETKMSTILCHSFFPVPVHNIVV